MDNLIDDYETFNSLFEEQLANLEEQNKLYEGFHGVANKSLLQQQGAQQNEMIEELRSALLRMNGERAAQLKSGELIAGSKEDRVYQQEIENVRTQINAAKVSIQELNQAIREVNWNNWNLGLKTLEHIGSQIDSISGIIGEFTAYDDDAKITKNGVTQYNLLAQAVANGRDEIAQYQKAMATLKTELKNGVISQETYNAEMQDYQEKTMSAISATHQNRKAIIDLVKQGIEAQTNAYSKLIDKQKESLQRQKEAVDYDRTISDKQTEINKLRAQLSALSGDTTLAAQAQRARLQAELAAQEQELADTRRDHEYDMAQQALDDELNQFTETQEKKAAELDYSLANQDQAIQEMLGKASQHFEETTEMINQVALEFGVELETFLTNPWKSATAAAKEYSEAVAGVKISENTTSPSNKITTKANNGIGVEISVTGYLKETKDTNNPNGHYKDKVIDYKGKAAKGVRKGKGLFLTDEEGIGTEALITKEGVLRQLDSDTVFSKRQTDVLWNLSKMDFSSLAGNISNSARSVNVTNTYDSLLTVNGNVDKDALPGLQEILKQASEYTRRDLASSLRKLGIG